MSKDIKVGLKIDAGVNNLKDLDRLINSVEDAGNNVDFLRLRSELLAKEWDSLNTKEQSQRLRRLKEACVKTAQGKDRLSESTKKTAKEFKKTGKSANELTEKTHKLDKANSNLSRRLKQVGASLIAYFSIKNIGGFFGSAVSGAANLEEQLDKVQAVSGATAEQMGRISDASKSLGTTTKYTATQAAEGFEILARAGLNAEQSLTAIPSVLDLATASGLELADSASFITKAISGMNLPISESGRVADVLAKAAASANTDVTGLGQALSYAAPSASSLGVSLEDTVAIIGKFADSGIDASRAGTALNSIMSQFSNPASKFRKELSAIGISTGDFTEALRQLESSGASGADAINAVGQEAGPALKALLAQGLPSVDALSKTLRNADGSAKSMADTMQDNLKGSLTSLGSAWDGLKISLGKPFIEPVTNTIKDLTNTIRDFVDSGKVEAMGKAFAETFTKMSNKSLDFIKSFNFTEASQNIDDFTNRITVKFDKIGASFGLVYNSLSSGFNTIKAVILGVASAVSNNISVMSGAIASLMSVIPGLGGVSDRLREVSDGIKAVSDAYKEEAAQALDNVSEASDRLKNNFDVLTDSTQTAATTTDKLTDALAREKKEANDAIKAFDNKAQRLEELKNIQQAYTNQTVKNYTREKQIKDEIILLENEIAQAVKNKTLEIIPENEKLISSNKKVADSAKIIAEKSKSAFEKMGVDIQKITTGISKKASEAIGYFNDAIAGTNVKTEEGIKKVSAAIEQTLKALNSPEEFTAFNEKLRELGIDAQLTAEQIASISNGMENISESSKKSTESTQKSTEATKKATQATKENAEATEKSASASEKHAEKMEAVGSAAQYVNDAIKSTTAEFSHVKEAMDAFDGTMQRLHAPGASIHLFMQNVARAGEAGRKAFENWKEAVAEASDAADGLAEKTRTGSLSLADIERAAHFAKEGVGRLDDATLEKLNSSIDKARNKLISLEQQAAETANRIADRLADATGSELDKLNRRFDNEIAEIKAKRDAAKSDAAKRQYEQALRDLEQLRKVETDKQKNRDNDRKKSQSSNSSSSLSSNSSSALNQQSAPAVSGTGNTVVLQMGDKNIPIRDVAREVVEEIRQQGQRGAGGLR